jgi:outer membrane receptor protein involved in Fe transport
VNAFRKTVCAAALLCAASPAFADGIETVTITAKPLDPVGNKAFSVVTIDASQLQATDRLDVALEQVPGLSLFRRDTCLSANPTTQGVSLRSIAPSGAGRALVTLDGVPQNDPFGGWVFWCALPNEDIDGVEVVRGAGAGPYGAGALTGVIGLAERRNTGFTVNASAGELGYARVGASGGADLGQFQLFGSASAIRDDGWTPVHPPQAGAADNNVTVNAYNGSLRLDTRPDADTLVSARAGFYHENRDSGLVDAASSADGQTASLTVVHAEGSDAPGWRLQGWLRNSNFTNTSVSVTNPGRTGTTPTNDQFATPAFGWGVNGALRGTADWLTWEVGGDARGSHGQSDEHYFYAAPVFLNGRFSGGTTFVGGLYAEGAAHLEPLLITIGIRADDYSSSGGHIIQKVLATDVVTLNTTFPSKNSIIPTARLGARYDLSDSFYVRAAAYEGFRAPSLNELYRPFRLGNNFTLANPALTPEKLYGLEGGIGGGEEGHLGGDAGGFSWNLTAFYNQLHGAISNVTIGAGPGLFPIAGFLPAGGLLIQRQNVGNIVARGVEGELVYHFGPTFDIRLAGDWVNARVNGGLSAPAITGKHPSQAPSATITGGFDAILISNVMASANVRYESTRYADDQNTLRLPPATTVSARLAWFFAPNWSVFVQGDNLFDEDVATTMAADGTVSYGTPRLIQAGFSFRG